MNTNPRYPIYIISKGRADSRLTQRSLEEMGVPYKIVIEECEYDDYAKKVPEQKILTLPPGFRENPLYAKPDPEGRIGGSIPARNFVWEHSISEGYARHWILDDNMRNFYRVNRNKRSKMKTGIGFALIEDFTERFSNVQISGMNYFGFMPKNQKAPPYYLNSRIYSCILIDNSVKHRWRGKFNEDTDLSLNILKDGSCSLLFNSFVAGKIATHTMSGGNTEAVYNVDDTEKFDNRMEFAQALQNQHPDVVKIITRWGRNHHLVDYSVFKQKLKYREDYEIIKGINEHGMKLVTFSDDDLKKEQELVDSFK
jgi:hypothetical protein